MKYYLIAGEASGDLHASHLMAALRNEDPDAAFRFYGGEQMQAVAGVAPQCHYRDMAYMGFVAVAMHARTILRRMSECKADILAWKPDVVILVDYAGFNLRIARYVKTYSDIPVFYYIAPKLWAWKEHRIKQLRYDVDKLYSIFPFEKAFFEGKHQYPISYVGNPTVDEVTAYLAAHPADMASFCAENNLEPKPVIALLAGSRRQEIRDNLQRMAQAASVFADEYQLVVAAAPGIDDAFYGECVGNLPVKVLRGQTYRILQHSTAALVTSGTATLETALFGVPQVVCYYMRAGRLANWAKGLFLKVPYISLVNLIAQREAVPELIAADMTVSKVRASLAAILPRGAARDKQLCDYAEVAHALGPAGAPQRAAQLMVRALRSEDNE